MDGSGSSTSSRRSRWTGWHFWRAGDNSDEILELAPQPEASLPIFVANEAFSRRQSWVEGALEAADAVIQRLRRA